MFFPVLINFLFISLFDLFWGTIVRSGLKKAVITNFLNVLELQNYKLFYVDWSENKFKMHTFCVLRFRPPVRTVDI